MHHHHPRCQSHGLIARRRLPSVSIIAHPDVDLSLRQPATSQLFTVSVASVAPEVLMINVTANISAAQQMTNPSALRLCVKVR